MSSRVWYCTTSRFTRYSRDWKAARLASYAAHESPSFASGTSSSSTSISTWSVSDSPTPAARISASSARSASRRSRAAFRSAFSMRDCIAFSSASARVCHLSTNLVHSRSVSLVTRSVIAIVRSV